MDQQPPGPAGPDVVVVGGGIAGLAAAHALVGRVRTVLLLEGSPELGGKLRLGSVAGVGVDVGAEALLNRRPEAVALARSVGLELEHPASTGSLLWTRGELRRLPRTVLGVPSDLDDLAATGVLSEEGLARARAERLLPAPERDESVAEFVGARLGPEVVDRLVEPLLGGVYAGHASTLSARATVPQVVALLDRGPSLLAAAAAVPAASDEPVFAAPTGGVGRLPGAVARALAGSDRCVVRTGATVRELRRTPTGFALTLGSAAAPETVEATRVVLAVPPGPAARLLAEVAPAAAGELGGIETASMAIVTHAFRPADLAGLPDGASGFLVPPVDGRRIKAATFSFAKWEWAREAGREQDVLVLRTSIGRHREEAVLQVPDEELVAASLAHLREATGLTADPVDSHVQRWGGGLPQYAVGHRERVARIREAVARVGEDVPASGVGLAVCGAAYDGIGIPACIASALAAVDSLP